MQSIDNSRKKGKSENVTPKKMKQKLYNYQYTVETSPAAGEKPHKITMNVSIDLSQNHKQKIIFIDKTT